MTRVVNIDIMNAALKACPHYGGVLCAVDSDERGLLFQWRWKDAAGLPRVYNGGVPRAKAARLEWDKDECMRTFGQFTHEMQCV